MKILVQSRAERGAKSMFWQLELGLCAQQLYLGQSGNNAKTKHIVLHFTIGTRFQASLSVEKKVSMLWRAMSDSISMSRFFETV
jgi:hypothetical protein